MVRAGLVALATLALFYAAFILYAQGQALLGATLLAVAVGFAVIFGSQHFYPQRFIFPGLAAIGLFVLFPVLYTIYLGFTNYSSFNLLTHDRATEVILATRVIDKASERKFQLVRDGDRYRVYLAGTPQGFLSEPMTLGGTAERVAALPAAAPQLPMDMREVVKLRGPLGAVTVTLPDGTELKTSGLRSFASLGPEYARQPDGSLVSNIDGSVLTPDHSRGFYITGDGKTVPPGWRVNIGWANFNRIFTSPGVRAPMLQIFTWTVVFAFLSVTFTWALGLALASVLQWPHLRGKAAYRILLILPYAVPAFISILVFRGLFNQNFGEINMILDAVFGVRPDWNTSGFMARLMLIIVNTWLGYPYMMLLAMGFLQSVPKDHARAAALEGASSWTVFRRITLPQIVPPFLPLLISSFAFNFNNIVLILLLTRGLPDIPGTVIPAGETDILGSFTYRMAFQDSGQQFGLAGAITFLIFIVVAGLAYANFVAMRRLGPRSTPR